MRHGALRKVRKHHDTWPRDLHMQPGARGFRVNGPADPV